MAGGAIAAGLPGELPVMGALVASDVRNLAHIDPDGAGYFGMRKPIWDQGEYAGFPSDPVKQLRWFTDQAAKLRAPSARGDELTWGEWVADVMRAAEHVRGRYQLELGHARTLIAAGCDQVADAPADPAPADPPPVLPPADVLPPALRLRGPIVQDVLATRAVLVTAGCPQEACTLTATGSVTLPGAARRLSLVPTSRHVVAGATTPLRLKAGPALQRAARQARRRGQPVRAAIVIVAVDAAGNRTRATRTVRWA